MTEPNLRRIDDLLSRRHLWDDEVEELRHLAALCEVKVRLRRLDLQTGNWLEPYDIIQGA